MNPLELEYLSWRIVIPAGITIRINFGLGLTRVITLLRLSGAGVRKGGPINARLY
jgi:hypothetical protein